MIEAMLMLGFSLQWLASSVYLAAGLLAYHSQRAQNGVLLPFIVFAVVLLSLL